MAIRETLLAEFDHEMAATRRLMACVPDAKIGWRPHERSRSVGTLIAHMTDVLGWSASILERDRVDLDLVNRDEPEQPASMAALCESFIAAATRARAHVDRSDAELSAMWSLTQDGEELFSLPRATAFRSFVLSHVVHHRGQLTVYLRLNDIPVPALYGPTADTRVRT
jgi:uncharacterized damage-inducible protein DinB